jgi:peptidoglycan biosynthesis protein MviN/MurJ (putative lipid II flippase)
MKRLEWAILRAICMGFGLAIGRTIVEIFFEADHFNTAFLSIVITFIVGFVMGFPFWSLHFPGNNEESEKQSN